MFLKINSIFLKFTSLLWYIGYVLLIPIIYSTKDTYDIVGWKAVGYYDFSLEHFIHLISQTSLYFSLFILSSLIINKIFIDKYNYTKIKDSITNNTYKLNILIIYLFIFLVILQFPVSSFMFKYKIGVVGIIPDNLPYHITGLLYYYRLFILPIILFILVYSTINKKYSSLIIFLIFLEASYSGLMSVSKSLMILHMMPIIYYFYYKKNNIMLYSSITIILFLYIVISNARNYVYALELFSEANFLSIVNALIIDNTLEWSKSFFSSIFQILTRLGGINEFIPTYFNIYELEFVSYTYFIEKLFGLQSYFQNNFNSTEVIYGLVFPADKAYGISMDNFSYIYLSSQNILEAFIFIFIFSISGVISERFLKIMLLEFINENNFIILFHIFILASIPSSHITIFLFKYIPILMLIYFIMSIIFLKKYKYKVKY
jgi:hypothetical protein